MQQAFRANSQRRTELQRMTDRRSASLFVRAEALCIKPAVLLPVSWINREDHSIHVVSHILDCARTGSGSDPEVLGPYLQEVLPLPNCLHSITHLKHSVSATSSEVSTYPDLFPRESWLRFTPTAMARPRVMDVTTSMY